MASAISRAIFAMPRWSFVPTLEETLPTVAGSRSKGTISLDGLLGVSDLLVHFDLSELRRKAPSALSEVVRHGPSPSGCGSLLQLGMS
jgi:hypothetical protein